MDGAKINMADYADRIKIDYSIQKPARGVDRGSLGCYLSHVQLWERIAQEKIPYALILEDDAVWNEDFARVVCEICACEWDWDVTLFASPSYSRFEAIFWWFLLAANISYVKARDTRKPPLLILLPRMPPNACAAFLYTIRRSIDAAWRPYYCWQGRFYRVHPPVADFSGAESTIDAVAKENQHDEFNPALKFAPKKLLTAGYENKSDCFCGFIFTPVARAKKSQLPRAQKS